jgi:hypothetical protein
MAEMADGPENSRALKGGVGDMDLENFTLDELHELRISHEGAEKERIIQEIIKRRSAGERFIAEKQVLEAQKEDRSSRLTCLGIAVFLVAVVIVIGWACSRIDGDGGGGFGGPEWDRYFDCVDNWDYEGSIVSQSEAKGLCARLRP